MTKVFLFMWMCSSVPGNECIKIPTPEFIFNDLYDCTVYGYAHSEDIIVSLTREFDIIFNLCYRIRSSHQEPIPQYFPSLGIGLFNYQYKVYHLNDPFRVE